jgi:trimethylamine--corrinoid protein Co-methyltransferase
VDAQAGLESSGGAILAALAGVNMVSGAGMMDFESCQSFEKLVIDAEIIGMAKRLIRGVEKRDDPIALSLIREMGHRADYLSNPHTLKNFQNELYIPSHVIDRGSLDNWTTEGSKSTFERAREQVELNLAKFDGTRLSDDVREELRTITQKAARAFEMDKLPELPEA